MKTKLHLFLFAAALLTVTVSPLRAQVVADGATNILSNVTNAFPGNLIVGTNGSFTLLVLSDNALLTNSVDGVIGLNTTARSNEVRLISATARWLVGNYLHVGSNGSFNRLVVSNGGLVSAPFNSLDFSSTSSNNVAIVTGTGSVWNTEFDLLIGRSGPGNQLVVNNGGVVSDEAGYLGFNATSTSNLAVIAGSGSRWSHTDSLFVGRAAAGNRLVVSNGAAVVIANDGFVGTSISSSNNSVALSGAGTVWSNLNSLQVGTFGRANRFELSDGAVAYSGGDALLSVTTNANSNFAFVTDPTTRWLIAANLHVGTNGAFNRLTITNGALVQSGYGSLGWSPTSSGNEAVVTGPGSRWITGGPNIGTSSTGNRLVISNGGRVTSGQGLLGVTDLATNNTAIVTGAGSTWSLFSLDIGSEGASCRMVISNGASVDNTFGTIGGGLALHSASNCEAVVTGPGSVWSNRMDLVIGEGSRAARLVVSNSAFVENAVCMMGQNMSASNCEAVVTGPGSVWNNRSNLLVGWGGSFARVAVTNGGSVFSLGNVLLGEPPFSINNRIAVDGGTLRATNAAGTVALDLRAGTNRFNAGVIEADLLRMTNTLGVFEFNGGTLITRGAFITNAPFVIGVSGSTPAIWDVRAGVSNHFLSGDLHIGSNASLSQLVLTNGALLNNNNGILGSRVGANSNLAMVAGMNSYWSNRSDLTVGLTGRVNQLIVSNGGWVSDTFGYVGRQAGSSNNLAVVTGTGSVWSTEFDLTVGLNERGNQLVVSNGGWVSDTFGYVGRQAGSSNNLAVVTGTGSVWSTEFDLTVGLNERGNQLVVSDGGVVLSEFGFLGFNTGSSNNAALVTGAGSVWSNSRDVIFGRGGFGNQLVVSNGGGIVSSNGTIGSTTSGNSNTVVLTDTNSVWNSRGNLIVGFAGGGNVLMASNGAALLSATATLGANIGNNNLVLLTGGGTVWSNAFDFTLGNLSVGNRLVVSNGALVVNSNGFLGFSASSIGNLAMVSGAGSVWSNRADLYVGNSGGANQLVASDGATGFVGGNAVLGFNSGANSNSVSVSDAGTSWLISSNLYVGSNGAFNLLVVSNGARVVNQLVTVGSGLFSSNNVALITGAGSLWSNRNALIVGNSGSGNRLVISNGATVRHLLGAALVGLGSSGSNNSAVVTGTGSFWDISFSGLSLGGSSGNRLLVTNGGRVRTFSGNIGSVRSDNEALLTGTGSSWTNADLLQVGVFGERCRLVVSNGAEFVSSVGIIVGENPTSTNNRVVVDGGTLRANNVSSTGMLDIRRGTNVFNAGLVEVDQLVLTNTSGFFEFNGGTLSVANSTVLNGQFFRVGNGVSPATFNLAGNGFHDFSGTLTTSVASSATLTGNGTFKGALNILNGGKLSPGASIGKIVLSNAPVLQGATIMEISKNGATLTNDQIQVTASLTYGGSLVVSNLGPTALATGDRFPLFSASSYGGSFSVLNLPQPGPGLNWTNKLLLDGSIEVVPWNGPKIGSATVSGTNLTFNAMEGFPGGAYDVLTTTNVATPLPSWTILVSGTFDGLGNTTVTNGIAPGEPARFFRLRLP